MEGEMTRMVAAIDAGTHQLKYLLSRAFPIKVIGETNADEVSAPILVPGLDFFNHSRDAKVTWTWVSKPGESQVTLTLHNRCKKDEQVFNSYGPKSNEELLASYGFVNDGMEDDAVTLKLGGYVNGVPPQQHYWRYNEPCPPDLLEEVKEVLRDGEEWEEGGDPTEHLMGEQVRVDVVIDMLKAKIEAFDTVSNQVDITLKSDPLIRPSVAYMINVYRKGEHLLCCSYLPLQCSLPALSISLAGQSRILHSALAWSQSRSEELSKLIDNDCGFEVISVEDD